jgi:predicted nucleotidyltransferase
MKSVKRSSVESIVRALNDAGVRYLVVGGLAVVAHGHVRFTADVDLLLDLDEPNLEHALAALENLGYRPRAPVPLRDFAVAAERESWIHEKGLTVFSLFSDSHPATEIDLFVDDPLGFDDAYTRAAMMDVGPGITATFVGLDDLIRLKRAAGRPQDMLDLEKLAAIQENDSDDG